MTGEVDESRVVFAAMSDRDDAVSLAHEAAGHLGREGVGARLVRLDADDAAELDGSDLVVSLGGDGTFLRAARLAHQVGARVLPVDLGRLGFLLSVPADELVTSVRGALASADAVDRLALDIRAPGLEEFALNEVVVERGPGGQMVRVRTYIEGDEYLTYSADGVMVATPTGSTGYSFSCGGPVVDASLQVLILTPIAPHFTIDRSIVVDAAKAVRPRGGDGAGRHRRRRAHRGFARPGRVGGGAPQRPSGAGRGDLARSNSASACARPCARAMPRAQLVELYARAVGVIDDAAVEFGPGFNVITGETGAGKTLLLGALDLCLGGDGAASAPRRRRGARRGGGLSHPRGRRGRPGPRLGRPGTAAQLPRRRSVVAEALRSIAARLVVVHGQHDSLALRGRSEVRRCSTGPGASRRPSSRRRVARSPASPPSATPSAATPPRASARPTSSPSRSQSSRPRAITGAGRARRAPRRALASDRARRRPAPRWPRRSRNSTATARAPSWRASPAWSRRCPAASALDPARTELAGALATAREAARDLAALAEDAPDDARVAELDERVGGPPVARAQVRREPRGGARPTLARLRQRSAALADAEGRRERLDAEVDSVAAEVARLAKAARAEREAAADASTPPWPPSCRASRWRDATLRFERRRRGRLGRRPPLHPQSRPARGPALGSGQRRRAQPRAPRALSRDGARRRRGGLRRDRRRASAARSPSRSASAFVKSVTTSRSSPSPTWRRWPPRPTTTSSSRSRSRAARPPRRCAPSPARTGFARSRECSPATRSRDESRALARRLLETRR